MYVDFNLLPGNSKVWIYQASGFLSDQQVESVFNDARNFVESWTAHQADLKASVSVFHNLFIVFAVDQSYNEASGCSIDKKVHFIKSVESKTGLNFFDRMNVAYRAGDNIMIDKMSNFPSLINSGKISDETLIFNNLISNLDEFKNSWVIPVAKSWLVNVI